MMKNVWQYQTFNFIEKLLCLSMLCCFQPGSIATLNNGNKLFINWVSKRLGINISNLCTPGLVVHNNCYISHHVSFSVVQHGIKSETDSIQMIWVPKKMFPKINKGKKYV